MFFIGQCFSQLFCYGSALLYTFIIHKASASSVFMIFLIFFVNLYICVVNVTFLHVYIHLLEPQNKYETYYIHGRHSNVDCFYLTQNYFKLPKQTIRENANFILILNHIYEDHVASGMPKKRI